MLLVFLPILFFTKKGGNVVTVSVDGVIVDNYPLSEDLSVEIKGYEGGTNYLVIKEGEAYLTEASCPDHLCIHMGRIKNVGQSIICLPNRVVIEITGPSSKEPEYDVTVG